MNILESNSSLMMHVQDAITVFPPKLSPVYFRGEDGYEEGWSDEWYSNGQPFYKQNYVTSSGLEVGEDVWDTLEYAAAAEF